MVTTHEKQRNNHRDVFSPKNINTAFGIEGNGISLWNFFRYYSKYLEKDKTMWKIFWIFLYKWDVNCVRECPLLQRKIYCSIRIKCLYKNMTWHWRKLWICGKNLWNFRLYYIFWCNSISYIDNLYKFASLMF